MKIICRGPKTGKTTELIKRCAENGGYIVCKNMARADFVMKMAREMNLKIHCPITFDDLLERNYHAMGVRKIYIDNADELIKYIAGDVEVDSIVLDDLHENRLEIEQGAAVRSMAEESRYRTLCVMAADMRQSGHRISEIAKWLQVSRREVRKMLEYEDVASLNRRGCRV